jgi:hypothetical protein
MTFRYPNPRKFLCHTFSDLHTLENPLSHAARRMIVWNSSGPGYEIGFWFWKDQGFLGLYTAWDAGGIWKVLWLRRSQVLRYPKAEVTDDNRVMVGADVYPGSSYLMVFPSSFASLLTLNRFLVSSRWESVKYFNDLNFKRSFGYLRDLAIWTNTILPDGLSTQTLQLDLHIFLQIT